MNTQLQKELDRLYLELEGLDYTSDEYAIVLARIKAIYELERDAKSDKRDTRDRAVDISLKILDISAKVVIGLGAVIIAKNKEAELVRPLFEQALEFETEGTFTSMMSRGVVNEIVKNI